MHTPRQMLVMFAIVETVEVSAVSAQGQTAASQTAVRMVVESHLQHDEEVAALRNDLQAANDREAESQRDIRALRMRLVALTGSHEQHVDSLDQLIRDLRLKTSSLDALLADTTVRFVELQLSAAQTQMRLEDRIDRIAELGGPVEDLRDELELTGDALRDKLGQLDSAVADAHETQAALDNVSRRLGRERSAVEEQREHIQGMTAEIASIRADSARMEIDRDSLEANVASLAGNVRTLREDKTVLLKSFGIVAILLLGMLFIGAIVVFRKQKRLVADQSDDRTAGAHPDIIVLYKHYRVISVVGRFLLFGGTLVTLILVGFVASTIGFRTDGLLFWQGETFWKTLASIAAPIGFLVTVYNLIEGRRLEATKLVAGVTS